MNEHLPNTDHPTHGSADMIRECLAECLKNAVFYTSMGRKYAAALDDIGCSYNTRRAVAFLRQAESLLADLKDTKRRDAERRGGEPAFEALEESGR